MPIKDTDTGALNKGTWMAYYSGHKIKVLQVPFKYLYFMAYSPVSVPGH